MLQCIRKCSVTLAMTLGISHSVTLGLPYMQSTELCASHTRCQKSQHLITLGWHISLKSMLCYTALTLCKK